MLLKNILAFAIFTLLPWCCLALEPNKAINQYVHDAWTSEDGLPEDSINSITQTRDGYLWIATYNGLVRFDGVHFTVFNKNNTVLGNNLIQSLLETRDGKLWIGSVGAGLYSMQHGEWQNFSTKEGLSNDIVTALCEDRYGNLWIGTRGGLNKLKDGKLVSYKNKEGFPNDVVAALHSNSRGDLWIGSKKLYKLTDEKLTTYTTKEGLSSNPVKCLYEDRQGNLWIGTNGGGINKLRDGNISSYSLKEGLSNDTVNSIVGDRNGNVWIATASSLNRLKDGIISNYSSKEGLSDDVVWSLYEDVEGSLWIGTGGGLNRFRDGKFTTHTMQEGLIGAGVWSISEDRERNIWIGTNAGLNRLKNGKVTIYSRKDGLSGDPVSSVYKDSRGSLWVGIEDGGLNRITDGKIQLFTTKQGLSGNHVFSLYEDRNENLWIGTEGGLSVFRDEKITSYPPTEQLPAGQVRAISEDKQGTIWIGMLGGLTSLKDGKFTRYTTKEGLSSDLIFTLYSDREGILWIGTADGLFRMKDNKFTRFTTKDGLHSDAIGSIVEDNNGKLWMCSTGGIFSVTKNDVNDFAEGKIKTIESSVYSKADGIKTRSCQGGQQPSIWKASDGRLWFSTSQGATVVDPQKIQANPVPPPVIIETILVDNQAMGSNSEQGKSENTIRIGPGKKRFQFRYTALSFAVPERVKFRFKLDGWEKDWIDAGTRRDAEYTNLSPGNYKFRVKACNEDGVWNEAGAVIAFYLEPRFYQTYWFYGLCFLAMLSAVAGGYRFRIRHLAEREKELIAAVERSTQDLRDANKRLQEAEDRILRMAESGPQAFESLSVWSKLLTEDITRVIGAKEIGIWKVEEEKFIPLVRCQMNPPSLNELKLSTSNFVVKGNQVVIPIKGTTAEIYGAIVAAREELMWSDPERHLMASFANRLGGTFEMEQMREKLANAQHHKVASLQEMWDQGIATLQLCPVCRRCYDHTGIACETDGAILTAPRILPHKISNRYRLTKFLGEGGMGAVFKAHDEKLRRDVSLKIIRAERLSDPTMRFRIKREAQILAQIQHPGVISIFDFGELPDGAAFMVMEYLEGEDLQSILQRQGPGTPQQIAIVLQQVGEALNTSHAKGVIHRDLKPSNLFVVASGSEFQIKVLDFGLAKSVKDDAPLTATGLIIGTPAYMSPEQAQGHLMNEQSDLFSLASLTYELLTGEQAFKGDNVIQVLSKIVFGNPEPLSSLLAGLPKELDAIFIEAMARNGSERPQNLLQWTKQVSILLRQTPNSVPGWRFA